MRHIAVTIKPASSMCNMSCVYCFYKDVSAFREQQCYGMMQKETADAILENTLTGLDAGDMLSVAFQGGEPTLAGLGFHKYFVQKANSLAHGVRLKWAFQTNGLLLDEAWCRFFYENDFLVGLSLDMQQHDAHRVDSNGKATFKRVMRAKECLVSNRVGFNILTVLTNSIARHPRQVWNFIMKHGLQHIQFIPCVGSLDENVISAASLTPERVAGFFCELIPLWHQEYRRNHYISIKFIDDLVNLLATGKINACGINGKCAPQLVVEADGSVYPCDFYVLDEYKIGSLAKSTIREIYQSSQNTPFTSTAKTDRMCETCLYLNICGGGCKRMRESFLKQGFCAHQEILKRHGELLRRCAL